MKRLLIVAPAFPPHPSPATHRARFMARWASDFGWEAEVATVAPSHYEEPWDEELWSLVPRGLRVSYAPALPLGITRRFGVGDLGMRSYHALRRVVRSICRERRPDALFIPGPPFHTFLIGADVRERFGIPYVLDYTDPWVDPPRPELLDPRKKVYWARRMALALEPRAARGAARLYAVSDATHDSLRARVTLPDERFAAEPIGFEPADFDALRGRGAPAGLWDAADGLAHVVYAGAVSSTMTPIVRAVCEALAHLRDSAPTAYGRLRVHFVGTSYDPRATEGRVAPIARDLGVADAVDERPRRVGYVDALRLLTAADVILGIGSTDRHYQASKIFNCIAARRPILGVYHHASGVCEAIRETNAGELITYGDGGPGAETVAALVNAFGRIAAGATTYDPGAVRLDRLTRHTARAMTGRMLADFDTFVGAADGQAEAMHA